MTLRGMNHGDGRAEAEGAREGDRERRGPNYYVMT